MVKKLWKVFTTMSNSILIIDDNAEFVSLLLTQLETEGYVVTSALNPITGWKLMEQCQPDIILVDWEMPQMNGIELVKLIKADAVHRNRYIIMITAHTGTKNIVQGLDAGADDYLDKLFEFDELLARIRSGLRIRSLENRISEETRRLTVLEMALSVADKIGNPIAAAKMYQQLLMKDTGVTRLAEALDSLKTVGSLLDEALNLIREFQSIKTPQSIPAPDGKTMIAPK
jgi:DNA-binding response OmpR family regulator